MGDRDYLDERLDEILNKIKEVSSTPLEEWQRVDSEVLKSINELIEINKLLVELKEVDDERKQKKAETDTISSKIVAMAGSLISKILNSSSGRERVDGLTGLLGLAIAVNMPPNQRLKLISKVARI